MSNLPFVTLGEGLFLKQEHWIRFSFREWQEMSKLPFVTLGEGLLRFLLSSNSPIQIVPSWIHRFNKLYLLFSEIMFQFFLFGYSIIDISCRFEVYKLMALIFFRKACYRSCFMFSDPTYQIISHPNIEDTRFTRKYVGIELVFFFHTSVLNERNRFSLRKNDKIEMNHRQILPTRDILTIFSRMTKV